jgi:hypothetical protein
VVIQSTLATSYDLNFSLQGAKLSKTCEKNLLSRKFIMLTDPVLICYKQGKATFAFVYEEKWPPEKKTKSKSGLKKAEPALKKPLVSIGLSSMERPTPEHLQWLKELELKMDKSAVNRRA